LAEIIMSCPATESLIRFMGDLGIPSLPYSSLVMAFRQASDVPERERRKVLGQHLAATLSDVKINMQILAKRRAQQAIIAGVLILLPALMIVVLAPPLLSIAVLVGGKF
jgi:hypothetical protein